MMKYLFDVFEPCATDAMLENRLSVATAPFPRLLIRGFKVIRIRIVLVDSAAMFIEKIHQDVAIMVEESKDRCGKFFGNNLREALQLSLVLVVGSLVIDGYPAIFWRGNISASLYRMRHDTNH